VTFNEYLFSFMLSTFLMSILNYFRKLCDSVVASVSSAFGYQSVKFKNGQIIMIGRVLGEGAFSFVYAAHSPTSNNLKYAVKTIFVHSADFEGSVIAEIDAFNTKIFCK